MDQALHAPPSRRTALVLGATLALLAMVIATAALALRRQYARGQQNGARVVLRFVAQAADQYRAETGRCPATVDDLVRRGNLLQKHTDAWGRDLVLRCTPDPGIEVTSAGPDRVDGTPDDLTFRAH